MSYKLLTYETEAGPRAGLLVNESVVDVAAASGEPGYGAVLGILADWDKAEPILSALAARPGEGHPALADIRLLAPILYPGQIYAAGANYRDHIAEMTDDPDAFPAPQTREDGARPWHFTKSSRSAVIGHGAIRPLPPYSRKVDWEIELAVVIGRQATNLTVETALDHVAGYTIANDLSARDFVMRPGTPPDSPFYYDWIAHKGFDGACPLGPWITPASAIADPQRLGLKLWVGDELMQNSNTGFMIYSIAEQLAELSSRVTLNPGDLVLTGTPSGVGMGRGRFLRPGERVRLWIEGIGELQHGFS